MNNFRIPDLLIKPVIKIPLELKSKEIFLILNLALAYYNVGTIWAHEVDIFRSWQLLGGKDFHLVQLTHWKKLPYWIFIPVIVSFGGSIALFWYHPDPIPVSEISLAFLFQFLSHALTGIFWGPWQQKLSKVESGYASPFLKKILKTHWIRTSLINANGLMLLFMTIQTMS